MNYIYISDLANVSHLLMVAVRLLVKKLVKVVWVETSIGELVAQGGKNVREALEHMHAAGYVCYK